MPWDALRYPREMRSPLALFARPKRALSHGCVGLEGALDLAAWLLERDGSSTRQTLLATIETGETKTLALERPVAIEIVYRKAWTDEDGTVEFRDDLYGREPPQ